MNKTCKRHKKTYHVNREYKEGQRDSGVGRAHDLYTANLSSNPDTIYNTLISTRTQTQPKVFQKQQENKVSKNKPKT